MLGTIPSIPPNDWKRIPVEDFLRDTPSSAGLHFKKLPIHGIDIGTAQWFRVVERCPISITIIVIPPTGPNSVSVSIAVAVAAIAKLSVLLEE